MGDSAIGPPWVLAWRDARDLCNQVWTDQLQALEQVPLLRAWGWTVQIHPVPIRRRDGLWVVAAVWHSTGWSPGDLLCQAPP
jgi:hypothetical protein